MFCIEIVDVVYSLYESGKEPIGDNYREVVTIKDPFDSSPLMKIVHPTDLLLGAHLLNLLFCRSPKFYEAK